MALRTELATDLPPVVADRVQLQQVMLNLMMNGIEAMSEITDRRRELIITTENYEVDKVRVTIEDSGIGFDPQSLERIFEPFYTTKPEGIGIGLSISRSIIEIHGGRLWAERNDGPGGTFQLNCRRVIASSDPIAVLEARPEPPAPTTGQSFSVSRGL